MFADFTGDSKRRVGKLSVTEFNNSEKVKRLSGTVHRYLNKELVPGAGVLGIKEK